jgi:hypothetical protein
MLPWKVQWKAYVPGFIGAVNVLDPLGSILVSKALPVSAVTVCASPSMFMTVTVAPGLTEAGVW